MGRQPIAERGADGGGGPTVVETSSAGVAAGIPPGHRWDVSHLCRPSGLVGANGLRFSPSGELHVAQFLGSQISAIDTGTGATRVAVPKDGGIVAPDDLVFDARGVLFATEVMNGRVSACSPGGTVSVVADGIPEANGITLHAGRIFVDEFRPGGRLLEIFPDGAPPRIIADGLPMPNALCMGPDGLLYFPAVIAGEIWRVSPEGGDPECICRGLVMPVSVKFDGQGRLVVTQSGTGQITRIDLPSGVQTTLGTTRVGMDNCVFGEDGRLFVSNFMDGGISEILANGAERTIVQGGLLGPWGLACRADGLVHAADGMSLVSVDETGTLHREASFFTHGFPGFLRSICFDRKDRLLVATTAGNVVRYTPGGAGQVIAAELDQVMGIVQGTAEDTVVACEYGTGRLIEIGPRGTRVLAHGLGRPTGISAGAHGEFFVADAARGEVWLVGDGDRRLVATGLAEPHGMAVMGGGLFIVDRAQRRVYRVALNDLTIAIVAENLPVGTIDGRRTPILPGSALVPGPLLPFAGVAVDRTGTLFIAGDSEGSIVALRSTPTAPGNAVATHPATEPGNFR